MIRIAVFVFSLSIFAVGALNVHAQVKVATTTLTVSICGDAVVNSSEECDVPGENGTYSTTIAGRQCTLICQWAPYCGDATLQTIYGEECDDGNNDDDDFCSAECLAEPADSGGGSSGGGGSANTGGQSSPLGDTQISVQGKAYPNVTVNILLDGDSVGSVRSNSSGEFIFNTDAEPGAVSMSFWAIDSSGTRSATFNTTFDVTQGAVTTINGVYIPPTIRVSSANPNPGEFVTFSGKTIPNVAVEVSIDDGSIVLETNSDSSGNWSVTFDTSRVSVDTHTAKARFVEGSSSLKTQSVYGTSISLFVGVEGQATSNSDLNRDGRVNLVDFSILIFWWGTAGGNSNPPADINQNGRVSLEDFSILLFNWTG